MAKLVKTPKVVETAMAFVAGENFELYFKRAGKALNEVEKKYPVIAFPRGDGQALYAVKSYDPLQLFHVPYGDAYAVEAALIRGLTAIEVRETVRRGKRLKQMFSK